MRKMTPLLTLLGLLLIACQAINAPFISMAEPTLAPAPTAPPWPTSSNDVPPASNPGADPIPVRLPTWTSTSSLPNSLPTAPADETSAGFNAQVAEIIRQIRPEDVYNYTAGLTGEEAVTVGGRSVWIETRTTDSEGLDYATQYVAEFMQAQGLSVTYQEWENDYEEISGVNVIGELPGTVYPDEVVVISAHIDNLPERGAAPGADDNASGVVGVMLAAERLSQYRFERTIRFVIFTGEEYCLCGSAAYAWQLEREGKEIITVYNMDMIAWDGNNDGHIYIFTRESNERGADNDLAVFDTFAQVLETYTLERELVPHLADTSDEYIDSWSFWVADISSVTALEDYEYLELNPYNHTSRDTLATLNLPYFTSNVQAAVATIAHLAGILP